MERTPGNIKLSASDSSWEEDDKSSISNENTSENTIENTIENTKHIYINLTKERNEIKKELSNLAKGINVMLILVYGFFCFSWYLMSIHWLLEPNSTPEIECIITDLPYTLWTFYERRNITSPKYDIYQPGCVYYDYSYHVLAQLTYQEAVEATSKTANDTPIVMCESYRIEKDIPNEITYIREFKIFCIRKALQYENIYMQIGVVVFAFPAGILADIYGRRAVYNYCAVLMCLSAFVVPISTNFIMFVGATFILGGTLYSANIMLAIIFLEIYRSKCRAFALIMSFTFFSVSVDDPISYHQVIEVWRLRKLAVALLHLICVFSVMIIPQSPRLLMIKRQFKTAWECLHELGSTKALDADDYDLPEFNFKYQVKVLTRLYLRQRIYIVFLLNGTATFSFYFFKNMKRLILKPSYSLHLQFIIIQIILLCFTAGLTFFYSRKATMCIYYIMLSLCTLTNMLSKSDIAADVSAYAGNMFSIVLYILSYVYLMEIFPTSHRGSCMGLYLSLHKLLQILIGVFIYELLAWDNNSIFPIFFCGVSMICALITIISPDTSEDIPDRKEDLFTPLPLLIL